MIAAANGNLELVQYFLDSVLNSDHFLSLDNSEDNTPSLTVSQKERERFLQRAIVRKRAIDYINARNDNGETAFFLALSK